MFNQDQQVLRITLSILLSTIITYVFMDFIKKQIKQEAKIISNQINKNNLNQGDLTNQTNINEKIEIKTISDNKDLIIEDDYKVLKDPLREPTRRMPRYIYGDLNLDPNYFNVHTRGYPDSYSQQGYLVDNTADLKDKNRILPLYGRQKYPNSVEYEYYIEILTGDVPRKFKLEKQKRELYDEDKVKVDIMNNKEYSVKMFETI